MKYLRLTCAALLGTIPPSLALQTDSDGFRAGSDNIIDTGARSIAAGWENEAWGGSIAAGVSNEILGEGNAAFGLMNSTDMYSGYSLLSGSMNHATNSTSDSVLFGLGNELAGQWSSGALGIGNAIKNYSNGSANFTIGQHNDIDGLTSSNLIQGTVLIGIGNYTASSEAWAIGKGNIAQSGTVTLGTYGIEVSNASLIVGTGTSDISRSNGLVVKRDGSVHIPSGNLLLGSSPSVTQNSLESHLLSNGYLQKVMGSGSSVSSGGLISIGSSSYANGVGAIAIGGVATHAAGENSLALGSGSNAVGTYSVAIGFDSATGPYSYGENIALAGGKARGAFSFASNYGEANGDLSIAMSTGIADQEGAISIGGMDYAYASTPNVSNGVNATSIGGVHNVAEGNSSFATGYCSVASSAYTTVIGTFNKFTPGDTEDWVETDSIFEVGNGTTANRLAFAGFSTAPRSNAITTLKNGRTTLTNKAWLAHVEDEGDPLSDPPAATDSEGQALVVEGHTLLKGKVIIAEPQGDISMGIYE